MGQIIGIDLGTTNSAIAYIKNGLPEMILNSKDDRITPSAVTVKDDDEIIVGEQAKALAVLEPESTVMEVKRFMGTDTMIQFGKNEYLPEEISAIILRKMKEDAELYLGEEVTEAVITVPANFNGLQREATKRAGEMAGFKVERIINEPTAAALAYGINNLDSEEKVLVYDFGGGTFDVTILELFAGVLDVKTVRGNNALGGKDIDERIEKYILEEFKQSHGIDLSHDKRAMARIKEASEKAKIELSSMSSTDIVLPYIAIDEEQNPLVIDIRLTRATLEELTEDLIKATEVEIDKALEDVGYSVDDIDVVLAVGGSSRIPRVRKLLEEKFSGKIKANINADEAVALGAAIQAGIKSDEISSEDSILITDICSYTLGTDVVQYTGNGRWATGVFDPIIKKNTKIPCTEKKIYRTIGDNQTSVIVSVYEGESKLAADNVKLREILLEGIPAAPAGKEEIEVAFTYNLNGILEVTAKILSTGKAVTEKIDMQDISHNISTLFGEPDLNGWRECELAYKAENIIDLCENKMETMEEADRQKVQSILDDLKKAIIDNDEKLVEKYDKTLTNLLFDMI